MDSLKSFVEQIAKRVAVAKRGPNLSPQGTEQLMQRYWSRREMFQASAKRIIATIVRPRLDALIGFFPNATLIGNAPPERCGCWMGYCERFPASVQVQFWVDPDRLLEHVFLVYELYMFPAFLKYDARDKLKLIWAEIQDQAVSQWVEQRLLEFLDTYLQLDRGSGDSEDDMATDPVCGMRIVRSRAITNDYRGHTYFFCGEKCRQEFADHPQQFVEGDA